MQFRSEAGGVEPNAIRPPDGRKIIYPERQWDGQSNCLLSASVLQKLTNRHRRDLWRFLRRLTDQ
jgi:hypothetical protein